MARKRKEKRVLTLEEVKASTISHAMSSLPNIPANIPLHRRFNVGDKVRVGALDNPVIEEVLEGGRIYLVRHGKASLNFNELTAFPWMSVKPLTPEKTAFSDDFDLRASYSNTCLDGLLGKVYHFGVDFNPSYQRGLVWTMEQKQALIKTIFDKGVLS